VLCYRLYAVLLLLCCTVICVALLLFVLPYVLIVCTVPLPPGVNPIALDKYISKATLKAESTAGHMELSDATGKIPAKPGIDPGTFRIVA